MNTVRDKLLIMNFSNENIGYVERTDTKFIQCMGDETQEFALLPPILSGIAPEPTQFPSANDVLEYYDMAKDALDRGVSINDLVNLPAREPIGRFKYVPQDEIRGEYEKINKQLGKEIEELLNRLTEGDV